MTKIERLRALGEKGTGGRWKVVEGTKDYQAPFWIESSHGDLGIPDDGGGLSTHRIEDARLIAEMRNMLPLFLDLCQAATAMGIRLKSLPWRRSNDTKQDAMCCLDERAWREWNYGECEHLFKALKALEQDD